MCLSRSAYVELVVTQRLRAKGVHPDRAAAVGRKVRRAYELKRQAERQVRQTARESR
jgi:hypothetical protein